MKHYYIDHKGLPLLEFYNTFIRITNPSHTHKFNNIYFKRDYILKKIIN